MHFYVVRIANTYSYFAAARVLNLAHGHATTTSSVVLSSALCVSMFSPCLDSNVVLVGTGEDRSATLWFIKYVHIMSSLFYTLLL